jgi:hypothetical protein
MIPKAPRLKANAVGNLANSIDHEAKIKSVKSNMGLTQ